MYTREHHNPPFNPDKWSTKGLTHLLITAFSLTMLLLAMPNTQPVLADGPPLVKLSGQLIIGISEYSPTEGTYFYTLHKDQEPPTRLILNEDAVLPPVSPEVLNLQYVTVTGQWTDAYRQGVSDRAMNVQSIELAPADPLQPANLTPAAITGNYKWAWILCKFADYPMSEPATPTYFQDLRDYLNTYFKESSYDKANIDNSTVSGWYTLPKNRADYVPGNVDFNLAATDCTALADPTVDFSDYYGLNLMFNDQLASSYGTTTAVYLTLDGVTKWWPSVFIDSKGSYNYALTAHEMYHGFGLGHSGVRDSGGNLQYGNSWDPVGWGACGFFSCDPSHTPAPQKDVLGWIDSDKKYTYPGSGSKTLTLEGLALPQTSNELMAILPIETNHYYTIEARRKRGTFDDKVPEAIVIHEVLPTYNNGNIGLIPVPGRPDPGGSGAAWLVGDKFTSTSAGVEVTVVATTTSGFTIEINPATISVYLPIIIH